ncbi:putative zn 2cys6 transcription factor [Phaeomoniella chlamydospora]|uniref:Putative zn 2cys6 transcription factor n=1 Tax=Phaeomoniella chlamydospora TaxID=158046 RepID=A0A0G2EIA8_PHACM|nr:putative zn 2cys6 transcription factor [Phaeomoniella chlamydospora]
MPSSSAHPTPSTTAPWKPLFATHVSKLASPEFSLATVTSKGIPRTRTCIHRGFFASPLPENPHNKHPPNPHVYDSDCPTFTTDARMSKVYDIFASGPGKGSLEQSRSGSGGGGHVEACYWVKDTMCQWRIIGKCWLISADDIEPGEEGPDSSAQNSGTVTVKAELGRYMRPSLTNDPPSKIADWSWKREVETHFTNLSPIMRGSFKNPPPGQPVSSGSGPGEKLGQTAGDLEDEPLARQNFRVAVIAPEVVEMVDLSNPEKSRRVRWCLSEEAGGPGGEGRPLGEWNEIELWP